MAFLTSYRAEKVYFEKLRSNIDIAKSYIQRGATDEVMTLLQNAVDADGAIMLCYRNLGEVWADLAAQLEKTQKALEDLKTALEEYHDDLNKKIDEINNYLVRLINALDERVTILENESKVKFAYLNHDSVEDVYSIEYNGETADFGTLSAALEYPHLLVLIDNENGNIYYPRSVSDVLIDFHADGVSGSDYVDISVTMTDSDVVTVTEKTVVNYTFGTGFNVSNTNEVTPDLTVLQAKLTAGTGVNIDPDTNEISADFTEVQEKLTAGFGVEIDSNNEISVDTNDVQEKLIAGQNITMTPDATDPTKTVISAGGSSYTAGHNIDLTNDIISNKMVMPLLGSYGLPDSGDLIDVGRTVGTGLYNKNATFKRVLKNQNNKYKKLDVSSGGTQYSDSSFVSDNTIKTFLNNNPMTYEEFYLKYKLTIFAGDSQSTAFTNATPIFTPFNRSVKVYKKGGLWFIDDTNTGIEQHIYDISVPTTKYFGIQLVFSVFFDELVSNTNCDAVANYFLNKMGDIANLVCFVAKNY